MHLLVTGVGGFVGTRLARWLAARGERVSGTYLDERPQLPGVDLYAADLLDHAGLAAVMREADPDAVVHLAGLSHIGEAWQRMPDYFWVNVVGTENVLAAAGVRRARRVVIASSADVYGAVPEAEQPIGEQRPIAPQSPYALTKAAAERLALKEGAIVVRSFNLVGPGQNPKFALPAFARQLAAIRRREQEPVLRVGNLSARRDFVHVDDGVEAYRLLAERGEPGGVYNLASGQAVAIEDALARLMAASGVSAEIRTDPTRVRPIDLPLLCGDSGRLRALGWAPQKGLDAALADLWAEVSGA